MSIFADTSFLIALLDDGDEMHVDAVVRWRRVVEERLSVVTSTHMLSWSRARCCSDTSVSSPRAARASGS